MKKHKLSPEDILNMHCLVCFVPFDRAYPKDINEGNTILACSQCNITVHKCCYDFQPTVNPINNNIHQFVCEMCQLKKSKGASCLVCYGTEGAMKPLQNSNEYIHIYCALVHNEIDVLSYYPTLSFRKAPHYEELSNICQICMKRNAHDNCAEESCRRKVHTYCAKKMYVKISEESEEPNSWNHHISTGNHGNFDISDQVIPYQLLSEEVDQMVKPMLDLELDLSSLEGLKKKVYKEYTDELRGKRKTTKKLRRGGFSYVLCNQHESTPYCMCQVKEGEVQMVLCECCFEWYHQKCINFDPNSADEKFICHYCKVFYQFKRKAVEEVRGGRSDYDITKIELPLKISMSDCLWVMRVVDNRIRGGQASKMLKELSKYPCKSSCMDLLIRQVSRHKLQVLAEECVGGLNGQAIVSQLHPRVVLGLEESGRPTVMGENVEYNKGIKKVVDFLVGLMDVEVGQLQAILDFKEKALTDQYEQIIELCSTQQPYQEVPILKQKAQAYQYLGLANKLQNHQPISYETLINNKVQIANHKHAPAFILNLINAKLQVVQPIVQRLALCIRQDPQNNSKIKALLAELDSENIEPIDEYLQLKNEKKFIMEVQLYYQKHEGVQQHDQKIEDTIQQLLEWKNAKPSQELVQIVSNYHPVVTPSIWKKSDELVKQLKATALEFQIKDILRKKIMRQERLLSLPNKEDIDTDKHSQQTMYFLDQCLRLKGKISESIRIPIDKLSKYEEITNNQSSIDEANNLIEQLGVRIEDDNKHSLVSQLKTRKQQLEQLLVMLTELDLPKNPLTISKILPTLTKNNPLVKQYFHLKKQHASLFNKYTTYLAKISERIEMFKTDSKKQRKDQIKENNEKPSLADIKELIETIKQSSIDMGRQQKQLQRILNNTLEIASKVRKYCEEKNDLRKVTSTEELSHRKKQIEQLRKRVLTQAQLNLKTELLDLYHLQIMLRVKNALLTPNLELDKIGFLLKVAEEEHLTHEQMYIQLKERFQTKNQKSKEVNQVKHVQQSLLIEANRDITPHLASLSNYRRNMVLTDPADVKIKNSYLEDLVEKNKNIRNKISKILSGKNKLEFQQVRPIYLEALKNPFTIPELSKLTPEINKTYDIIRRWKDLSKNYTIAHPIFNDYKNSIFTVDEIEKVRNELRSNEEEISHLKFLVETFSAETADQMEEIIDKMETNPVIKDTQVCISGQMQYLQYWLKLINHSKNNKELISFEKMKKLALDAYNLLQKMLKKGQDHHELHPIISEVEKYLDQVKKHLKTYPKFDEKNKIVDNFIDLEDFYFDNEDEHDLSQLVPLLRPYDDMPKFRVKNLQRLQSKRQQLPTVKRSYSKFDEVRGDSQKMIQLPLSSSSSDEAMPQVVSDNERRKIKQIILKNIRKNVELIKYGECENEVKMIENQIFGQWHNDIVKYFEMSDCFEKLFIKLIHCPHISNKIIKKKFEFKFIQLLVNNLQKIDELENMIIAKNKQEEAEKNAKEIITPLPAPAAESHKDEGTVAKFDESAREQIKKEMQMIKESREGKQQKHKKKKHHKHKDREHSPQARFSSDSEKELPKYIENQYNREEPKVQPKIDSINSRPSDSPLRYDPEEEELLKKQIIHPKGSILKLKTCTAEVQTRRMGKAEFDIDVLTEEEHKRILEFIDPGFTKLTIHKYKNEAEMLPYINKSRRKYRFLVGWLEAVKPEENEYLRQLAEEATQKKKIFGWQNEHVKVHMMSIHQLITLPKLAPPNRVTTIQAAQILSNDRMVIVMQFPEKLYEIRDKYKPFEVTRKEEEHLVNLPAPVLEQRLPANDYYQNYNVPTIEPLVKPAYKEPEVVYQTWGEPPPQQQQAPLMHNQYGLPQKVNQIRIQYNFGVYSPINSDSEDKEDLKEQKQDLAANLLNSFDVGSVPQPPSTGQGQDKNQQYQGYYSNYQPYPQSQQRPMQSDNRWMGYQPPSMPQQPQNVYNPLNPMASKYQSTLPPQNQMQMGNQYKNNPMMNRGNPQMGGQYYDHRYQGYQQQ